VANGVVYVGSQTAYNSAAGKLNAFAAEGCGDNQCPPLSQGDAGSQSILESSPTVADGLVFVGAYDGKLYAFNPDGCGQGKTLCELVWTAQTGGPIESTPTVQDGVIFVRSDDGNLYAFRTKDGDKKTCMPLWTANIGGPANGRNAHRAGAARRRTRS
jgi:outer membrane protein assembly factor BamB